MVAGRARRNRQLRRERALARAGRAQDQRARAAVDATAQARIERRYAAR